MAGDGHERGEDDALLREVLVLRARVAELQRAAARHEDTAGISLAEREELLHEAERAAHLGTWTWDVGTGRVTWSDELFRILGREPGSITPSVEHFFAAVHPEDRARAEAASAQSLKDGVLPPVDCRVVRPDGSVRHTTSSSSMLFDAQGTVRRIVGAVLDRTESVAVETKLRRTLALLEEAQSFAQLGNWRYDPATGDHEWSAEFRRIAGLPPDIKPNIELFLQCLAAEDRERLLLTCDQTLQQQVGREFDGRLLRPDGQLRHVRLTGFTVVAADGANEMRGTVLDVTDQVRMREELAHAQKMQAVGRLAGGIAHDFNNLLTVITGNLELLAHRLGQTRELDNSFQALSSAAGLTRRLLAFGRKAPLSLKVVAPNTLVRSTTVLMHRLVGDEVRLELDLAPDLPQVRVDLLELERALVNLVVNARDAMPAGGVVRIGTAKRRVDDTLMVEFSVADEGRGIDEADRPHIFEPFFTTREHKGGTGLGLATVLGTAEQHGGTVRMEARPGGGSTFTIALPAIAPVLELEPERAEAVGPKLDTRPLNLLVIDDETQVADVTRRMLQLSGHQVRVASRPDEALCIWAEHGAEIDLVICDVVMAHMRGPELVVALSKVHAGAEQAGASTAGASPRVLFITGYSEEAARSELGHPVLAKPFSAAALLRAIGDAVHLP
jgi:two-component system cell cycle sensor histidine kinase/response regulator CckA